MLTIIGIGIACAIIGAIVMVTSLCVISQQSENDAERIAETKRALDRLTKNGDI